MPTLAPECHAKQPSLIASVGMFWFGEGMSPHFIHQFRTSPELAPCAHRSASIDNADNSAPKFKFPANYGPENWHGFGIFPKMGVQHRGFRVRAKSGA